MQIIEQRANHMVKYLILLLLFTFSLIPAFRVFAHFFNLSAQNFKNRLSDRAKILTQSFYSISEYDETRYSKNMLFCKFNFLDIFFTFRKKIILREILPQSLISQRCHTRKNILDNIWKCESIRMNGSWNFAQINWCQFST